MTITLDIKPEVQAELARQAAASGRALEVYAASLLEEAMHLPSGERNDLQPRGLGQSLVAVCAMIAGQTDDVAFSRDSSTWRPLDLS